MTLPERESRSDITRLRRAYDMMLVALFAWMFVFGPLVALFVFLPQARDRLLFRIWQTMGQTIG